MGIAIFQANVSQSNLKSVIYFKEITSEEVPLGSAYLRAGAFHYGKYCEVQNNEFLLCRHETRDPVKCLPEGKIVTACANEFFKKVKATCAESFTQYAMCLEQSTHEGWPGPCRDQQFKLDGCLKEKLDLDRPPYGYFGLIRVHDTTRPKPEEPRPTWLDDPRGEGRRADVLPEDFPRTKKFAGPKFNFT